uniref:Uncharacterized protein n=1 Tax=Tanacetum cinerariifolium TaxID=118510 RepID=A0A6L2JCF6_TANCI|nr:hypothetical protein [Tanacetum cinerariifolium]
MNLKQKLILIEQILPSPSTYQRKYRKTYKPRKAKKVTELPQTSMPLDIGADEAVHQEGGESVERAITTDASLVAAQDSDNIAKTQSTVMYIDPIYQEIGSGDRPMRQETTLGGADVQTRFETASKRSNDPPLSTGHTVRSGEDRMEQETNLMDFIPPIPYDSPLSGGHTPGSDEGRPNINELMNLCTKLPNRVLALDQFKTAQDLVIKRLQKKVKRLEKKQRARTLGMKLFKIGTSKKKTLDKENVSKQGRDKSNRTEELNLSDKGSGETEVFDYTTAAEKDVNAVKPVSSAGDAVNAASVIPDVSVASPSISDAGPCTSTAEDIFKDEMTTMADTFMAIRRTRPKTTSVVIHDVEEEPRRSTPPPTVQSQDKEKATEQEAKDAALIEQMEDVQVRIDADALLAKKLQQEEREQFIVDEQAKMLVDLIAERKREQKWINDFVLMDSKEVNDSELQAKGSKKRSRVDHDKESVKKQKLEEDNDEKEELRACLDIVPVDDIAIDVDHWLPNIK